MSDFRPFSVAEAAQGAAVLQNVQNNALAMAAARDKQERLSPLLAAAAAGDQNATRGVVAIDPELGNQILTATSKMDDNQRTQFKHSVETKGSVLQAVMNVPDVYKDQAWESAKAELVETLGPDAVRGMPDRFDPNWTQMNIDKAMSVSELLRGDQSPASIQEFKFYEGLDDPKKKTFMDIKRGGFNVGGVQYTSAGEQIVDTDKIAGDKGKIDATSKAAEASIEQSNKAIESLTSVRKNMSNIDEAIAAIDAGAESGAIASRLPSITAASIELDNVRSRMGLDVISGTTFGALSAGELKFALDSAIPKNLSPTDLKSWLIKKKDAQQKLAKELEDAAIYLGKPGNTPAGYLEFKRNQQQAAQPATPTPAKSKYQIRIKN